MSISVLHIILHFRHLLLWNTLFVLVFSQSISYSQVSPHEVKAALILRFCENVNWPKPINGTLTIACLSSDDAIFRILKSAEGKFVIQNSKLSILKPTNLKDIRNYNALYIDHSELNEVRDAARLARENNVLLITDNYPDLLHVMINLIDHERNISFKVNSPNLTLAGFSIKPSLLMNGGSMVDIRTAYEKFEIELEQNKLKIAETEHSLLLIEKQLLEKDKVIKEKELEIEKFEKDIEVNQLKFNNLIALNDKEKNNLNLKVIELRKKEENLERIYKDIIEKQKELKILHEEINSLKQESFKLKDEVSDRDSKLYEKENFISNQHKQILLYLSLIGALIVAAMAISRLFFIKKRSNKELEKKVNERTRELQLKNKQYLSLFDNAPSAIIEVDFSEILALLHKKGIKNSPDFLKHIDSNPEFVPECMKNLKYIQINNAHLELYGVASTDEISKYYSQITDIEAIKELGKEFSFILTNESRRSYESVRYTKEFKKLNVLINWIDISETPNTFNRVILTTIDITHLRKIESELRLHQESLELLVKVRTDEIGKLNEELMSQNEELNDLNDHLEDEVNKRTATLKIKNEIMAAYAFKNAHNVRGPLARILGLIHLHELKAEIPNELILFKIGQESREMDLILRQISDELYENQDNG